MYHPLSEDTPSTTTTANSGDRGTCWKTWCTRRRHHEQNDWENDSVSTVLRNLRRRERALETQTAGFQYDAKEAKRQAVQAEQQGNRKLALSFVRLQHQHNDRAVHATERRRMFVSVIETIERGLETLEDANLIHTSNFTLKDLSKSIADFDLKSLMDSIRDSDIDKTTTTTTTTTDNIINEEQDLQEWISEKEDTEMISIQLGDDIVELPNVPNRPIVLGTGKQKSKSTKKKKKATLVQV